MATYGLDTYQALLDRFAQMLQEQYGDRLISVILFGSVARGSATPDSDVDLLVVIAGLPERYGDRLDALLPILLRLRDEPSYAELSAMGIHPSPSLILFSPEEADQNRPLYLDMIEDCVQLIDKDGFFKKRLRALRLRLDELGAVRTPENGGWYWDLKPTLRAGETLAL